MPKQKAGFFAGLKGFLLLFPDVVTTNVYIASQKFTSRIILGEVLPLPAPTENALRKGGRSVGADNGIRNFEPLAITGLQVVEKISTHS